MTSGGSRSNIQVGDTVRLTAAAKRLGDCPEGREDNATAKVQVFLDDVSGGFKTDRDLRGCRYWNVVDVVRVGRRGKA